MKFRVHLLVLVIFVCVLGFPGCSSNTISITLSPTSSVTINSGQTQNITATVANDHNNEGVTWSVSGFGSLTDQTSTSVTYVAPVGISTEASATITATSVANTTITATLTITVNPVLQISTTSLPVATLNVPYVGVIGAIGATGTFTWTLTSGHLPEGLFLSTSTSSSISILGTPTALGTSDFTIETTDASGQSVSATLGIIVNPPPPLSIATTSLPDGMVGTPYNATLQASSGKMPYNWTYTGNLPPGNPAFSISAAGVITGTPTVAGTFPPFSVTVTDSSSPTQKATANLSITVEPSNAGNSRLTGNYAFLVSGFAGTQNFAAAGSFLADGSGNIAGGLIDTNTAGSVQTSQAFTGTYSIGTNGLGTMALNIPGAARTFAVSMMADGNAKIIEFDDTSGSGTRNSGVLLLQNTSAFLTSQITGNYAFGFLGADAQANRYGFAGQFTANGGNFTNGLLDSDDNGTAASSVSFTGTYFVQTTPANGRGTATITTSQGTTNYSFYVVSATQLLVMEIDSGVSPLVSGSILQQDGPFSSSSLNGNSILATTALANSTQTQSQVGIVTSNGGGGLSFSANENTAGTLSTPSSSNGSYAVTSGRVTLTNSGIATPDPVLYLVSTNQAFIVGTDPAVTFGFMEQETSPFTLATTYAGGSLAPVQSSASDQVDIAVGDGLGNLSFTTDASTSTGLFENQVSSGTCSLASNGECALLELSGTTGYIYVVSPTEFYELYTNSGAMVEHFQQ